MVPPLEKNKVGATKDYAKGTKVDFSQVFVATPDDEISKINEKLAAGLHLVLTPGVYSQDDSIKVTKSGTVILGVGFPTLIAGGWGPSIVVEDVDGVRIAGVLLEASSAPAIALL